jgi:hypothetical protein
MEGRRVRGRLAFQGTFSRRKCPSIAGWRFAIRLCGWVRRMIVLVIVGVIVAADSGYRAWRDFKAAKAK